MFIIAVVEDDQLFVHGFFICRFIDHLFIFEHLQHGLLAADGVFIMQIGGEGAGTVDHADQHGQLAGAQLIHVFAEIIRRGLADAVDAMAEIQGVEVAFQDVCLAVMHLETDRIEKLLDLALQRLLIGQKQVFGILLRDGRSALQGVAVHVVSQRGDDADRVNAHVQVETAVFHGDEGVLHLLWDVFEIGPFHIFAEVALVQDVAIAVI